ncbi:MAG TPA: transcriptional repressor LexA [Gemmatimonadaceae bacterium]|nr:transcriptional repressor LexA [Gemmatimonadaceae bacterium]
MSEPLTTIERRVYHYLLDFLAENTYQPSIREIASQFRIKSTKTVSDILQALAEKGYIQRDRARSRGVRLLGYSTHGGTQPVPYYGRIAAGEPALLPENRLGFLTFDRRFLPSEDVFALRVRGDSMIGRGIHDGDFVVVQPSAPAKEGDVIAARVGADATVKTLTRRGATIVLQSANPAERDIEVGPQDDFAVLGVVCGIFRPLTERAEPGLPTFEARAAVPA